MELGQGCFCSTSTSFWYPPGLIGHMLKHVTCHIASPRFHKTITGNSHKMTLRDTILTSKHLSWLSYLRAGMYLLSSWTDVQLFLSRGSSPWPAWSSSVKSYVRDRASQWQESSPWFRGLRWTLWPVSLCQAAPGPGRHQNRWDVRGVPCKTPRAWESRQGQSRKGRVLIN